MSTPRPRLIQNFAPTNPFDDELEVLERQRDRLYRLRQRQNVLNGGQEALQWTYRYVRGVSMAIFFGAEVFPPVPQPWGEMLAFAATIMNVSVDDSLHALLTKQYPMAYFNKVGRGNTCKGFGEEGWKFVVSFTSPLIVGLGTGYVLKAFSGELAHATHPALQALNFMATTPVIHGAVAGLIGFGMHSATRSLIGCCDKSPTLTLELDPELHPAQRVVGFLLNPLGAISLYEVLRLAMIAAGAEPSLHDSRFPVLVVACGLFLSACKKLAYVPNPINSLVANPVIIDEKLEEGLLTPEIAQQSLVRAKSKSHALGYQVFSAAAVLGVSFFVVNEVLSEHWQKDKETLSTGERFGYSLTMAMSAQVVDFVIEQTPYVLNWAIGGLSRCTAGLFSKRERPEVIESETNPLIFPHPY